MCGCLMALRYDGRGSQYSKSYYNGNSSGGNGKDRWNHNGDEGRNSRFNDRKVGGISAAESSRKTDRKSNDTSVNRHSSRDRNDVTEKDKSQPRQVHDWTEHISSSGKKYYYNCHTEVSQWEKPPEWIAWERRHGGGHDSSRKRRHDRQRAEESNSPSHSSLGRPGSSRDVMDEIYPGDAVAWDHAGSTAGGRRRHGNDDRRTNRGKSLSSDDITGRHIHSSHHTRNDHAHNVPTDHDRRDHDHHSDSRWSKARRETGVQHDTQNERYPSRERSPRRRRIADDEKNGENAKTCNKFERFNGGIGGLPIDIDPERLPHLLMEIADKHGIDLSESDALDKIKQHLRTALCRDTNVHASSSKTDAIQSSALTSDEAHEMPRTEEQSADNIQLKSENDAANFAEPEEKQGAIPHLNREFEQFVSEELSSHVHGWAAEHFELQAIRLADAAFRVSLDVSRVSTDLKCARSLVRTAEIRSTLLEQRIHYLRQQYTQLDCMSRPNASASVSSTS